MSHGNGIPIIAELVHCRLLPILTLSNASAFRIYFLDFYMNGYHRPPMDSLHKGPIMWSFDIVCCWHEQVVRHVVWNRCILTISYGTPLRHSLLWRHNGCDGVSNHQHLLCLLSCLFRRRSKKTSKLHVTGLCTGNSPVTGEFPAQMTSNAENISILWRQHVLTMQAVQSIVCTWLDSAVCCFLARQYCSLLKKN